MRNLGVKKGLLISFLSGALVILLLEGGARLLLRFSGETILTIPAEYYWENKPNMRKEERGFLYETNSLGCRGPEFSRRKRPGTVRVVCLGDSSTFGFLNREEECYPSLLRSCLEERGGKVQYEVINAGVSGYTTLQQAIALTLRVLPLEPDVVVIQCGHNNRSMSAGSDRSALYATANRWGKLTRRSRFIHLMGKLLRSAGIARRPVRFALEESIANVRGDLGTMVDLCRARGARVIFLSWGQHPDVTRLTEEGILLYRAGRISEAIGRLEAAAAIEYNWDWRPAHYLRLCYEKAGDAEGERRAASMEKMLREEHPWVVDEEPYLAAYRQVARSKGVQIVEYRGDALKPSYYMDICHPSPEFTRLIARDLCRLIAGETRALAAG